MSPRTLAALAALAATLSAVLKLFPRIAMAGMTMPTGVLIVAAEVLAAAVLIRMAWRACSWRPAREAA